MTPEQEQVERHYLEQRIRETSERIAQPINSGEVLESMLLKVREAKATITPEERANLMAEQHQAELATRYQSFKTNKRLQSTAALVTKQEEPDPQSLDSQQVVSYITKTLNEANGGICNSITLIGVAFRQKDTEIASLKARIRELEGELAQAQEGAAKNDLEK